MGHMRLWLKIQDGWHWATKHHTILSLVIFSWWKCVINSEYEPLPYFSSNGVWEAKTKYQRNIEKKGFLCKCYHIWWSTLVLHLKKSHHKITNSSKSIQLKYCMKFNHGNLLLQDSLSFLSWQNTVHFSPETLHLQGAFKHFPPHAHFTKLACRD